MWILIISVAAGRVDLANSFPPRGYQRASFGFYL